MRKLVSMYTPRYVVAIVYMLQSTEYEVRPYLAWLRRVQDFTKVMYRRELHKTRPAMLLLVGLSLGMSLQVVLGVALIWVGYDSDRVVLTVIGTLAVATYPFVWAYGVVILLVIGRALVINPKQKRRIARSGKIFADHKGRKIAVAGSYGKTSMKELLVTVLSEGKRVAATPANKNVALSHAQFAEKLTGDEDIVILEYGEGRPGDVEHFAEVTKPNEAIITGIAPAHLDHYPSLEAAATDIFSVSTYVGDEHTYVNANSEGVASFLKSGMHAYSEKGALGWNVSAVEISIHGTSFRMHKGSQELVIESHLLGRHHVGPLAFVAAYADKQGLTKEQIEAGTKKTKPFEHRMEARNLHGAWLLDDTYNGNIDGMKAGLALLGELPAKRKIYVTPGLVDQGIETARVHSELGQAIARTKPDLVVLMDNSATTQIQQGLEHAGYEGKVQIEDRPLEFYNNLEHFVAAGDVIMLQNDWTDNYN